MESHAELCLRVLVGAVLGGIIGYERDLHGRAAGLRTHVMVALASATFMVVSTHFAFFQMYHPGGEVKADGSRIAASVVSGIGFLAGGAIFRTGASVKGLTTAGGLWLVSAVGLTAGAGMYTESTFSTFLGLAVLTLLRRFERHDEPQTLYRVTINLRAPFAPVSTILARIDQLGARALETACDKDLHQGIMVVHFEVRAPATLEMQTLLGVLDTHDGVQSVALQRQA